MSSNDSVDLDTYLSVLDREQLHTIIVKLIVQNPDNFELLEEAAQFLDQEQLINTLEPLIDIDNLDNLIAATAPLRERFLGYMKLQLYENALTVLYAYSNQLIMNIIEMGLDRDNTSQQSIINELETDWKSICDIYSPSQSTLDRKLKEEQAQALKDQEAKKFNKKKQNDRMLDDAEGDGEQYIPKVNAPITLMEIFSTLAEWHQQFLQILGPIFGDSLRVLKLRVLAEADDKRKEAATKKTATAQQPKEALKKPSTKRDEEKVVKPAPTPDPLPPSQPVKRPSTKQQPQAQKKQR